MIAPGSPLGRSKKAAVSCAIRGRATTAWRALEGKAWMDTHLFNGEYYYQAIDLKQKSIVEQFDTGSASMSGKAVAAY